MFDNTEDDTLTTSPSLDDLLARGARSAKFATPGDTYSGPITSMVTRHATEYQTGRPITYDDGTPRIQIVITVQTEQHEDDDDDGRRAIYVKTWGAPMRAFRAAVAAAGRKPEVGDRFHAVFTGTRPNPQGGFDAKQFEYLISPTAAEPTTPPPSTGPTFVPTDDEPPWAATPTRTPQEEQAVQLIGTGLMTDQQIASVTGLPAAAITALRPF